MTNDKNQQQQEQLRQDTIDELQADNARLRETLQLANEELKVIKTAVLSGNINAAVHAVHWRQEQVNNEVRNHAMEVNSRKANARALKESEEHEAYEKRAKESNPHIEKSHSDRIAKAKQEQESMTNLAKEFYNLSPELARKYTEFKHNPAKSAVQNILTEIVDDYDKFEYFECSECGDRSYHLSEFENHCFLRRDTHESATIRAIDDEYRKTVRSSNTQMLTDIDLAITGIQNKEFKEREDKELKENERLRQELPYVK